MGDRRARQEPDGRKGAQSLTPAAFGDLGAPRASAYRAASSTIAGRRPARRNESAREPLAVYDRNPLSSHRVRTSPVNGQDVFFGCLGVACIIVALATARAIPEMLRMIERITLADPKYRQHARPLPGPPPAPGSPWGERPSDRDR